MIEVIQPALSGALAAGIVILICMVAIFVGVGILTLVDAIWIWILKHRLRRRW